MNYVNFKCKISFYTKHGRVIEHATQMITFAVEAFIVIIIILKLYDSLRDFVTTVSTLQIHDAGSVIPS